VPTLALVVVLGVTLSAGRWQLDRAHGKRELQARIEAGAREAPFTPDLRAVAAPGFDPGALAWRPLQFTGRFDPARTVFLDNRLREGRAGYEVLGAFEPRGSDRLLMVNRGWVAAGPSRDRLPEVALPEGEVTIAGTAVIPGSRFVELRAGTDEPRRWQNWSIERARERWGERVLPFALQQTGAATDGLVREWPRPDAGVDKHLGYALQWFCFAATAVVVWLALSWRRD
jgi:surfeit locus 1 family protein